MTTKIDLAEVRSWLDNPGVHEFALIDVREFGQYGEAHLLYATSIPYSRLEADIERLAPCKATQLVLHDDGASNVALRAAQRATALGYRNVSTMDGGTREWER